MRQVDRRYSLAAVLGAGPGFCCALVGAGGKTTSMLALARDLCARDLRVAITTTTKIWPPTGMPVICMENVQQDMSLLEQSFFSARQVALGRTIAPDGKLHGIAPEDVCMLRAAEAADVLLCEADGSAGRPIKGHRLGEPVVPSCITHLISVVGLDALHCPLTTDIVHRVDRFRDLVGLRECERIEAVHLAAALLHGASYAPPRAERVYVVNKVEDSMQLEEARRVAQTVALRDPGGLVLAQGHGGAIILTDDDHLTEYSG